MKLDFVSIILFVAIGQGLFLLFILIKKRAHRKYSGRFFSLLLIIFLWFQLEFLAIRMHVRVPIESLYITRFGGWLVVGPLLWFYTQSYLNAATFKWRSALWLHFVPFLLFALLIPILSDYLMISGRVKGYGMLTIFDAYNAEQSILEIFYGLIFISQFVHAFIYTLRSFRAVNQHETQLKEQVSNLERSDWGWMRSFHKLILVILISVAILVFCLFVLEIYRRQMDYFFVIPTSFLIYFFSFRAIGSIDLVSIQNPQVKDGKYARSTLTRSAAADIQNRLLALFSKEHPYLDPNLRLGHLASTMGVSSHHLSQVISENLETNFYDLINRYRIDRAKEMIGEQANQTLLQIGLDVGFNNKTSFNNAFKKHEGMTPSAFRQSLS